MAAAVWKSSAPLALRFSALILAAVLVNPHLFIYDLLVLAPVLLLLADWAPHPAAASIPLPRSPLLLYLAFVLPLFGPLSRWTHVQLSVPVFAVLLWVLWRTFQNSESQTCLQRIRRCITLLPTGNPMRIHKTVLVALMFVSCALTVAGSKQAQAHARRVLQLRQLHRA